MNKKDMWGAHSDAQNQAAKDITKGKDIVIERGHELLNEVGRRAPERIPPAPAGKSLQQSLEETFKISKLEGVIKRLKQECSDIKARSEKLTKANNEAKRDYESRIASLERKQDSISADKKIIEQENAALHKKIDQYAAQNEQYERSKKDLETDVQDYKNTCVELNAEIRQKQDTIGVLIKERDLVKDVLKESRQETVQARKQKTSLEKEYEKVSEDNLRLKNQLRRKGSDEANALGLQCLLDKNYEAAIEYFRQSIRLDRKNPNRGWKYCRIGIAYVHLGKYGLAKKYYTNAMKHVSKDSSLGDKLKDLMTSLENKTA